MLAPLRFRVEVTRPRDPWDPHAVDTADRYAREILAAAALYLEERLALEHGLEVDVTVVDETDGTAEVVVRGRAPAPALIV